MAFTFTMGEKIPEEKLFSFIKETIIRIREEFTPYGKAYLKKVINCYSKSVSNIFTLRRQSKEPFKTIIDDFILFMLTKENKKIDPNYKPPQIQKPPRNWPVSVIETDRKIETYPPYTKMEADKYKNYEKLTDEEIEKIKIDKIYLFFIDIIKNYKSIQTCIELNEETPLLKSDLLNYFTKKAILSCLGKLLFDLAGKMLNENTLLSKVTNIINNNKIYFIDMNESIYSFTLYDGTILINKSFYELLADPGKDKPQFGRCLIILTIIHEITFMLTTMTIKKLNPATYFKYRKQILEDSGEYLEDTLLGKKKKTRNFKGKKIVYSNLGLLPLKNVKFINNTKNYSMDYIRFRRAFVKIHSDNPITSGDKLNIDYIKFQKIDLNYSNTEYKKDLFYIFRQNPVA